VDVRPQTDGAWPATRRRSRRGNGARKRWKGRTGIGRGTKARSAAGSRQGGEENKESGKGRPQPQMTIAEQDGQASQKRGSFLQRPRRGGTDLETGAKAPRGRAGRAGAGGGAVAGVVTATAVGSGLGGGGGHRRAKGEDGTDGPGRGPPPPGRRPRIAERAGPERRHAVGMGGDRRQKAAGSHRAPANEKADSEVTQRTGYSRRLDG